MPAISVIFFYNPNYPISNIYFTFTITFMKFITSLVQGIRFIEHTLFFWVIVLFAFFPLFFFIIIIIITIELTNQRFFCNRLTLAVTFWVQLSSYLSLTLYRTLFLSRLILSAVENINDLFILLQLLYFSPFFFVRFLRTFNWIYLLSVSRAAHNPRTIDENC